MSGLLSSDNPYSCRDEIEKWLAWDTAWHKLALEVARHQQNASKELLREPAAIEIHRLRQENERYRKTLEVIAGSSDRLQALQAAAALDNIGPSIMAKEL